MIVTPRVAVDALIRYKGGIVLIKRKNPPYGWAIPGGFVDVGETVEKAVIREAKEETNLDIRLVHQFHVYSDPTRDPRGHTIGVVFVAEGFGELKGMDDAVEAKVVIEGHLPEMAFDHKQILLDYFNETY